MFSKYTPSGPKNQSCAQNPSLNGGKYYWILFIHTIPVKTTVLQKRTVGPNFKTIGQHYFATSTLEQYNRVLKNHCKRVIGTMVGVHFKVPGLEFTIMVI